MAVTIKLRHNGNNTCWVIVFSVGLCMATIHSATYDGKNPMSGVCL